MPSKLKRLVVDGLLEPLLPLHRLESWLVHCARRVVGVRKPVVVGITGSAGKSTTTAMIATILSHADARSIVGEVGSTTGNMNDDVGVAATLLRFDREFDFASLPWSYIGRLGLLVETLLRTCKALATRYPRIMVLECGAGASARLHRQAGFAKPSIAVVTTIGAAHLEKLKSLDGVVQEKSALVRAVPADGLVVLGQDHDFVPALERASSAPVVRVPGQGVELSAAIARIVCRHLRIPDSIIDAGLKDFSRLEGRLNRLDLGGITVLDDTYNANPVSMQLGIDTLVAMAAMSEPGVRRVAILGAMGELGENAARYHADLGEYARGRVDVLIGVGELAKEYRPHRWFEDSRECADHIEGLVRRGDFVIVKGSASMRMGEVVGRLRARAGQDVGVSTRHCAPGGRSGRDRQ